MTKGKELALKIILPPVISYILVTVGALFLIYGISSIGAMFSWIPDPRPDVEPGLHTMLSLGYCLFTFIGYGLAFGKDLP